ncbi:MAG: hypothetical protein AAF298_02205 [Cyanobacteria bacterium P01_A01_bin.40]
MNARKMMKQRIIASLAGKCDDKNDRLDPQQLETIKQKYFYQDYFFLVYGCKVPQVFHKECSTNQYLNKGNAKILTANINENPNPLYSETIKTLVESKEIELLTLRKSRPNPAVREYILFKLSCNFQGELEGLISLIPCLHLYAAFSYLKVFKDSPYVHRNNEILAKWIDFLDTPDNVKYFRKFCTTCNALTSNNSQIKDALTRDRLLVIFRKAWNFEYQFFQSLL